MRRFTEHGSIACSIQDQILFIEGSGPWNLEALEYANFTYDKLMSSLHGKPWGKIVVLQGDPIYVPDAADYLVKAIRQDRKDGCIAAAVLLSDSNCPEFAKRHLSEIHTKAEDQFRFFTDKPAATYWLEQQLLVA